MLVVKRRCVWVMDLLPSHEDRDARTSEVATASPTSTIRVQPFTLCHPSMSKQTLSGSWKYKCQVFPHENSRDLEPEGKQGPIVSFPLISLPLLSTLCFPGRLFSPSGLPFPPSLPSLPASATRSTGPVHLLVDGVVVISCGSWRGQWPAGVW